MNSNTPRLPLLMLVVVALAACSSDGDERPEYQGAQYYNSLEIPPDLTLNKTDEEVKIPEPSKSALAEYKTASNLDQVVVPEFEGIRLKSECGLNWLEMNITPEAAWPKLEAFWEHEGIRLLQDEPLLGFMETEWTNRLVVDEDAGFMTRMFNKMEAPPLVGLHGPGPDARPGPARLRRQLRRRDLRVD